MNARWRWLGLVSAAALVRGVTMSGQMPEALTAPEQRGRDIYFGVGSGIKAVVGIPPIDAPSTLLGCVNCHGRDGKGKSDGQVVPSDITWDALTKPYGVTHASGRTHQPYTERLLVRAICMGLDPGGHALNTAMPRFQMSREDIAALTVYLKRLGRDGDAGIDDATIRLATIVPAAGPFVEASQAIRAVLAGYFDALNKQGGIYNRRLELSVATLDEHTADTRASVEKLIVDARPFAMVGGAITSAQTEIVEAAERRRIPFINPLATFPQGTGARNGHTFYLLSGAEQQARVLIDYAAERRHSRGGSMAIVYSERITPPPIVSAIEEHGVRAGWNGMKVFNRDHADRDAQALVDELNQSHVTHLLLMADGPAIGELAAAIARTGSTQVLLIPGAMVTDEVLTVSAAFAGRLFLALPSLPSDQTPRGSAEYRALAEAYRLPNDHIASQIAALGSAKVLTHAFKLAGRALTREKVVAALESLYDFDTGLMPRVAFSANRRIGASGAYIVTVDPDGRRFKQVTGWMSVE
jgi:ABC-type branched-subunit amino acid transport system substrate-binding protein